jgi:hypothetical protein
MIQETFPGRGELPPNHHEVLYWRITDKPSRAIFLQIISVPLFVLWSGIFYQLAIRLGRLPASFKIQFGPDLLIALFGIIMTLVLHEFMHGITMQVFGAHPQYGVLWKQLMFYATSPGYVYPRGQFLAIALAPLVLLSLLAVLGMLLLAGSNMVIVLSLLAAINAAGAIGDLWIVTIVLRYPSYAYIMDERDGIRVFLPII